MAETFGLRNLNTNFFKVLGIYENILLKFIIWIIKNYNIIFKLYLDKVLRIFFIEKIAKIDSNKVSCYADKKEKSKGSRFWRGLMTKIFQLLWHLSSYTCIVYI